MALQAPAKALALVLFLAAVGGATYGVMAVLGDTVGSQVLTANATRTMVNATPGHEVSYLVTVTNRDASARDVAVEIGGPAQGKSDVFTVRGDTSVAVFVTVDVPTELAEGEHRLDLRILDNGTRVVHERAGSLRLQVLPEAPGFENGDSAEVYYVGRLSATGRVFNTNDPALVGIAFPKTDSYRFSQGLLPIETTPRVNVVPGLYEGMLGMREGEHRTISFPPEKGYGPSREEQPEPRDEYIRLNLTLQNDLQRVPRTTFDTYVEESGQGRATSFREGSIFTLFQNGNNWPYRVVNMSNEVVEYRLAANPGEAYTIYPFWANASVVRSINDTHINFYTTPNTEIGQRFTMKAHWPEMTALFAVNETSATVRHTPPVGFSYTSVSQFGQPREARVLDVNEQRILVGYPAQNPLAGLDLTFDVILVALHKA